MSRFQRIGLPLESASITLTQMVRELLRALVDLISSLYLMFDKGIGFDDNLDADIVSFTSNAIADTEDAVAHDLDRVPTGYMVASQDKAGSVYKGTTAWTSSTIYLKTSAAAVAVKIVVF